MSTPRVVHIDDSEGFRLGLPRLLRNAARIVSSYESVEAFLASPRHAYDLIMLDLELAAASVGAGTGDGPRTGTAALRLLLDQGHGPVLVCTGEFADIALASVIQAGAIGVINKSDDLAAFVEALDAAVRRERYFSPALASAKAAFDAGQHVGVLTHVQAMALHNEHAGMTAEQSAAALRLAPRGGRQQISERLKQSRLKLGTSTTAEIMLRSRLGRLIRHSDVPR